MKKTFLSLVLLAGSIAAFAQNNIESIGLGSHIPLADRKMKSVGKESMVALKQSTTKNGLLVMFSCNTCPYVIKAEVRTSEMMKYVAEKGIGMVIVNSNEAYRAKEDAPDEMAKYAKAQRYTVPYIIDENSVLADAFGATRTPEVFLFDGGGKLVYKGAMEDNPSSPAESTQMYLKSAIDNMLSGDTIDPNSTKSIGCSIKRIKK